MTIPTRTIREVYAEDPAKISENVVLLVDPKKKAGHNRKEYPTFNFLVSGIFERGGKIFVRGSYLPSGQSMVLDPNTRIFL